VAAAALLVLALASCGADPVLERAQREYDAGKYRDAVAIIRLHFKKDGEKTPELLFLAGAAYLRSGSEADAQSAFDQCRTADPSRAAAIADFLRSEAMESINGGDAARGKRLMSLAVLHRPGTDFGKQNLLAAEIFLERRDFPSAIMYLERFVRDEPDDPRAAEALIELAAAYQKNGASGRAIEVYRTFQLRFPRSRLASDAVWELETLLLRDAEERVAEGGNEEAEAMLVDLAATAASPIVKDRSNFLLGEICEARGDARDAVRYYRAVVDAGTGGRLVDRAKERIEKLDASKRRR
jgi:tetratricopeptide (TPR) repeat protein